MNMELNMDHLRDLYEEMILDHNRNPRNFGGELAGSNRHAHGFNPVCNDEFSVHLQVSDGVIENISFEGAGCAISTAMWKTILGSRAKVIPDSSLSFLFLAITGGSISSNPTPCPIKVTLYPGGPRYGIV